MTAPGELRGLDDGTEPYCKICGEWAGLFLGLEGWHHFRGDPAPGGVRTLYDADHEAVIGWRPLPPVLDGTRRETLRQALTDAIDYRADGAGRHCGGCEAHPAGLCEDCTTDIVLFEAYRQLARDLGIRVPS